MWLPIAIYVAMTLFVPILNGAPTDAAYREHAVMVLSVSAFALIAGKLYSHVRRH